MVIRVERNSSQKIFVLYLRSFSATRSAFFANRRGESRLIGWLTKSSGVFYYPRVAQRVFEHPCGDWLTRPPEFCTIHGSAYEFFTMRADFSWRVKVFICRCTWPSQGKRAFTNRRNDSRFIEWRPRNLKFFATRGQCKKFFLASVRRQVSKVNIAFTTHGPAYKFLTLSADFSRRVEVSIFRLTWPSQRKCLIAIGFCV